MGQESLIRCDKRRWLDRTGEVVYGSGEFDWMGQEKMTRWDRSNVQNAAKLVSITYPRITVVHGAEHVVSLFFKDIFTKMPVFQYLSQFLKRCRNIFGSTCHGPHAIFKKHSIMHNKCIYIGFIKISDRGSSRWSSGQFFPSFSSLQKYLRKSFVRTTSKNKRTTDWWGAPFYATTFFHSPPLPPPIKWYHSLHKGIRIFSRRYQCKTALRPHEKPKWVFWQYFVNSSLNPTILVSYHVVNTLMMKTWTSV
jgi:hypothetical protein